MSVYLLITEELSDQHLRAPQKTTCKSPRSTKPASLNEVPRRPLSYLRKITLTNTDWSVTDLWSVCRWDLFVKSSGRKRDLNYP